MHRLNKVLFHLFAIILFGILFSSTGQAGTVCSDSSQCDDGNPCTLDTCDVIAGTKNEMQCNNTNNAGVSCSDGNACNGEETCQTITGTKEVACQSGEAPDSDNDGTSDCNDNCPNDPNKLTEGTCGCGVAETDSDGDTFPDCNDLCPDDSSKNSPGACGCGTLDTDTDGDQAADCTDECDTDPNKKVVGVCGCGVTDADSDTDGIMDCQDSCIAEKTEACDGKDNNCDGVVDEGCSTQAVCGNGVLETGEVCDDGNTVDGDSCAADCMSVPVTTCTQNEQRSCTPANPGQGRCAEGSQGCNAYGVWGTCAAYGPDSEICDGMDNDCDGTIDNNPTGLDDSNACTIDVCDSTAKNITHTPVVVTDDGNSCTTDSCNPETGAMQYVSNGSCCMENTECDDKNACTSDACSLIPGSLYGSCVNTSLPIDDGNKCTVDVCDPATGMAYTEISCEDGDECTNDSCDTKSGCVYVSIETAAGNSCGKCGDGVLNTEEECDDENNTDGDGCSAACEQEGSITVCKIIADEENNIINGAVGAEFNIPGMTPTQTSEEVAMGQIPDTVFQTPITFNTDITEDNDKALDAQCVTYSGLKIGSYYYGEESITASSASENWATPLYNDGYTVKVENMDDDVFTYDSNLFDGDSSNDAQRNMNADGHIKLTSANPNRTLVILNMLVEESCQATEEVCDDKDNDCDQEIDEGLDCNPVEVCDGVDNNSDGQIDEGFTLNACGTCGTAPEEVCSNGVDDNCDGSVDENCTTANGNIDSAATPAVTTGDTGTTTVDQCLTTGGVVVDFDKIDIDLLVKLRHGESINVMGENGQSYTMTAIVDDNWSDATVTYAPDDNEDGSETNDTASASTSACSNQPVAGLQKVTTLEMRSGGGCASSLIPTSRVNSTNNGVPLLIMINFIAILLFRTTFLFLPNPRVKK